MADGRNEEVGVIAVLFLFVVGILFAAISLSMQTGQVIERRILADQAADSASYAFASKSAQGLNFIAANNLAIAGSSHMAGVIHIAADWGILLKALFRAKSMLGGGSVSISDADKKAYQSVYTGFQPIARLYFMAAVGLTRVNGIIRATFPYLGMIDAIGTGAANAPSSIIIPFGAPRSSGSALGGSAPVGGAGGAANQTFFSKAMGALKSSVSSLVPSYAGLRVINSDETFCLAYRAAEKALGQDRHKLAGWMTSNSFGGHFSGIAEVISKVVDVFGVVGVIGNFVGIKVGYAGCGFGETGETIGGSSSMDKTRRSHSCGWNRCYYPPNQNCGSTGSRSRYEVPADVPASLFWPVEIAHRLSRGATGCDGCGSAHRPLRHSEGNIKEVPSQRRTISGRQRNHSGNSS